MADTAGAVEHATTRYQKVEVALIDELQRRYRADGDVRDVATWLPMEDRRIILAVTLDADRVLVVPVHVLLSGKADLGPMTDFKRAAVAEVILSESRDAGVGSDARAKSLVAAAGRSPTASPLLEYEPLYRDLAEVDLLNGDREALAWLKRAPAHNLRFYDGDDILFEVVDLASGYLQLDELDTGLEILAGLMRNDPKNVWIYRFMATGFPTLGLTDLGLKAVQRGLALLYEMGDPEELEDEFLMARVDLWASSKQGREAEVSPKTLEEIERAMALDFDAGDPMSPGDLCRKLVPGWDEVPVKERLRFKDLPEAVREGI